jgi:hypothetical protein
VFSTVEMSLKNVGPHLKNFIQKWQSTLSIAGIIECWTIMERSTWQLLTSSGTLTCPVGNADADPMFQQAYNWMKASMAQAGIPEPAPGLSPWWCWVKRGGDSPKPYVEESLEDPVVLQLSIPAHLVALSCLTFGTLSSTGFTYMPPRMMRRSSTMP